MALLTVERNTPSPYESLDNDDVLSSSSYEGFVAREHLAVCLSPRSWTSLSRNGVSLPIHTHLKRIMKLMRTCDSLKMAVELENNSTRQVRKYLIVMTYVDNQDCEETLILGTEQEDADQVKVCLVLPVWGDTQIKLDGDGGFSVHTGDQHRIFKPMSVQSMWTTLQTLYKSTEVSRACNHYVGGLSHSWLSHYRQLMTDDWNILNEWNIMEDVVSTRSGSPMFTVGNSDEKQTFEAQLVSRLRELMLGADLEEVSSKQLRLKLQEEMKMDLKEYREFLDQQMLIILGQLEKPSKICDYLYLGSEWNAANLEELKRLGVGYIVNVTREVDNFFPEMFTYFNVRLYDLPDSELMKHWDSTYKFIKGAKEKGSKVLVHCKMGISRSAATVVAYKMKEYQLSLVDALAYVKSRRSCINPNDGFLQQLKAYEGILSARHNELWGKHAPNRLLPHQRTMSEPNIRTMSPNLGEVDDPLSPHHEEQPFTHQFMSTNDLQQEEHLNSGWSPTRTNLMNMGQVDKTEGVLQFINTLPPLSDDDEVYRDHAECSKPGHSSPFLTPPQSRRSERRKESPLYNSMGFHHGGRGESKGIPSAPTKEGLVPLSVGGEDGPSSVALDGCGSTQEREGFVSGSRSALPSACNSVANSLPVAASSTEKSVGTDVIVSGPLHATGEGGGGGGEEGGTQDTLVQTKQISSVPERVKEIEERGRGLQPLADKVGQRSIFGSTNSLNEGSRSASPHPTEEGPLVVHTGGSPSSKHASVSPRLSSSSGPLSPLQGNLPAFPSQPSGGEDSGENKEKTGDNAANGTQGVGVKAMILQMEELAKDTVPVLRRKDSIASVEKIPGAEKRAVSDAASVSSGENKRPLSGGEERKKDEKEEKKDGQVTTREEEKKKGKENVTEEEKKKEKEKENVKEEEKRKEKENVKEEEKKKEKEIVKEEEKKKVKDTLKDEDKKTETVRDEMKKEESVCTKEEDKIVKDSSDSEVNNVLALRKRFGDPEPKKPEPQQWQQLQLFAKVPSKSQEPARSVSPSLSTSATSSVKKEPST